jgi:beta-galactosidase
MAHMQTSLLLFLAPALLFPGSLSASAQPLGRVLVLEDFETPDAAARWNGLAGITTGRATHGQHAARVRVDRDHNQISSTKLATDWRGYDRLLFDVYSERDRVSTAGIRIYDAVGGDAGQAARNEYFDGGGKILLIKGWNHVEVSLTPLKAATYLRDIALDRIRRVQLSFPSVRSPETVYIDNLRLAVGSEGPATASRLEPADGVSLIDNRWVTVRQVARPGDVPESAAVAKLRKDAEAESTLLNNAIDAARTQGIPTIYAERRQVTAELGLRVRPLLAWFNNDEKKREMFSFVAESCRRGRQELEDLLRGATVRKEADDTRVDESSIRPLPPLKGRPIKDQFFRDDRGEPMMILSVHSPSQLLQRFFATPWQHIESYTVGGGSRWSIDESPVYAAFQRYPDTHRVGWDGWCGHLVRDLDSMGGTKKENTVICLESPHIKEAIAEYVRANIPRLHKNPELLYDIMAYELTYICYCDRSQQMFRQWLEKTHGTIERANQKWGTAYRHFSEVAAPPVEDQRPAPGTNRGLWYDWARFNQDRFTDHLLWVRDEIRKIDPSVPLAAGGSSSMLAGHTGTSGIDEERIVNEVDDVIIHEGGDSTLGMDLQLALSERKKPLADPEMSLRSAGDLLPHFLHGKSVAQIYHWPAQPAYEFYSNNRESLAHSWDFSLADVDEVLRTALDVRRLNNEIAAFAEAPAEIAILYSQTSTLQLPPEMLTWRETPYLAELRKAYAASQFLDAKVTFVTERQARKGLLSRFRLLLVPGVRNIPADVVESIRQYISGGGHVLILPESLLGDEYNRPQDYLAGFGVRIGETRRPQAIGRGGMTQGYDQSFSREVAFTGGTSEKLKAAGSGEFQTVGELETSGVRQTVETIGAIDTLYRYPDGKPAIVRRALGKGVADYAASSLEERSYARLLEKLAADAGVTRPVRIRVAGDSGTWNVEARFTRLGTRRLLYVANFNSHPVRLDLSSTSGAIGRVEELRDSVALRGSRITVPGHGTNIYELFD